MEPHRLAADRQVVAVEHQLLEPRPLRDERQPLEQHPDRGRRHRRGPVRGQRWCRTTPDLRRDRRPRRIVVGVGVLDALEARAHTRDDERSDPHPAVTHHDRQVRHATSGPRCPEGRVNHVVGDHDRQTRVLLRHDDRAAAR